jgi:hypothetical protein
MEVYCECVLQLPGSAAYVYSRKGAKSAKVSIVCRSGFSREQREMRKQIFNYFIFRVIGVIYGNKHPAIRKQFAAKAAPTHLCEIVNVNS